MQRYLLGIDRVSMWVGKTFAWLIVLQAAIVTYDISARYLFRAPTSFAYDAAYILYGTLFMMGGAYALSRQQHVRGDIFSRTWPLRVQAGVDLFLYFLFFLPGILALISVGWQWALLSYSFNERSALSSNGPVIWPLKFVIPVAGAFMLLQGVAEIARCIECLRTGEWPPRLADVEETETRLAKESQL